MISERNLICYVASLDLQELILSTKGDVTGTTAVQRLGLTQEAPLSPILFLIYIDYLAEFCPKPTTTTVQTG